MRLELREVVDLVARLKVPAATRDVARDRTVGRVSGRRDNSRR